MARIEAERGASSAASAGCGPRVVAFDSLRINRNLGPSSAFKAGEAKSESNLFDDEIDHRLGIPRRERIMSLAFFEDDGDGSA